jgi:hypothetical protein
VNAADEHPVFGPLRRTMPAPMARTYPLAVAVDAVQAGIRRRARVIHVPRSLVLVKAVRAALPRLVELGARRVVPNADRAALADVRERGTAASAPVGPGGRAAMPTRGPGG